MSNMLMRLIIRVRTTLEKWNYSYRDVFLGSWKFFYNKEIKGTLVETPIKVIGIIAGIIGAIVLCVIICVLIIMIVTVLTNHTAEVADVVGVIILSIISCVFIVLIITILTDIM